jgi:hypothetical protein
VSLAGDLGLGSRWKGEKRVLAIQNIPHPTGINVPDQKTFTNFALKMF